MAQEVKTGMEKEWYRFKKVDIHSDILYITINTSLKALGNVARG
jgi:hypothetical protein